MIKICVFDGTNQPIILYNKCTLNEFYTTLEYGAKRILINDEKTKADFIIPVDKYIISVIEIDE